MGPLAIACSALLILIALRPLLPRASAVGSLLAAGLFLTTLSFLFTTPGIGDPDAGGLPALSPTGQFLLKDLVLLGVAILTAGEALGAVRSRGAHIPQGESSQAINSGERS